MKIAHFGTFDVLNFGDLLFPLLAQRRLSTLGDHTLLFVSPVGGPPVLPDAVPSVSFEEFAAHCHEVDGILIGGGNIVGATPTTLAAYQIGFTPVSAYPDLWLGATALSKGAAVCWNAPGVPEDFGELLWPQIAVCLKSSDYVSVRDESSRARLLAASVDTSIYVVPDTAWEIDSLWSSDALRSAFDHAFVSRGLHPADKTIAFHVNERYLFGLSVTELAALLDETSEALQARPILIAMAPCHGDHKLAIRIGQQMRSSPLIIDQPISLCEITACLANSLAYVGSSMHGFITTSAYGVPAICVAKRAVSKFDGMIGAANLRDTIFEDWRQACEHLLSMNLDDHKDHLRRARVTIQGQLDEHWNQIVTCFQQRMRSDNDRNAAHTSSQLLSYRANLLAPVALKQMHETRRQRGSLVKKRASITPIDVREYDFLDFGCSKGGSMEFARQALGGQRGLGIDLDSAKVQRSISIGNEAIVADITCAKFLGMVRFVLISHFLEHLSSLEQTRCCIQAAVGCASGFVLIQQPYFDADGYLFERGLKFAWSDWRGHRNHVTATQFHSIGSQLIADQKIARFLIGRRMPITDSNEPWIHPLTSQPDQHQWQASIHPPKPSVTFDFPVFRELFLLILAKGETALDKRLQEYVRKKQGEILFDSWEAERGNGIYAIEAANFY